MSSLKMKEYAFTICIIVEQQYLFISWRFWFILESGIGVSDIWSTPVPTSEFDHVEIVKQITKSPNFIRHHYNIYFWYKNDKHIL